MLSLLTASELANSKLEGLLFNRDLQFPMHGKVVRYTSKYNKMPSTGMHTHQQTYKKESAFKHFSISW